MIEELCKKAKDAKLSLSLSDEKKRNECLIKIADSLIKSTDVILSQNAIDVSEGKKNGMSNALLDRLSLNEKRIEDIAFGLRQVSELDSPIGKTISEFIRPNGLKIRKVCVPFGVVGMIYESRPNVTADAFSLCFKNASCCILKGGSDSINSNRIIVKIIKDCLSECGFNPDVCALVDSVDREDTLKLIKQDSYLDLVIPRGSAGLINFVKKNSTVPMIETGTGNCHIYVDKYADIKKAIPILINAKTQRIGVCNACESLVVHKDIEEEFLNAAKKALYEKNVEIRADKEASEYLDEFTPASEEDFGKEYLDLIISVKTVGSLTEAIEHINRFNTGHSDCIITENNENAELFLKSIDSACVYVNASTRFTDGFEFGFGAEIGISTQKLHARGPMGLNELASYKYMIIGEGQVRE